MGEISTEGVEGRRKEETYICARFLGTINRSSPTNALPVALIRFSPLAVRGISDVPVCLPFSDHSVSPCLMMKTRGVIFLLDISLVFLSIQLDCLARLSL